LVLSILDGIFLAEVHEIPDKKYCIICGTNEERFRRLWNKVITLELLGEQILPYGKAADRSKKAE